MAEYIEREAFLADIRERYCMECDNGNGLRCLACWVDDMNGEIIEAPAADVVEVVRCKDCKSFGIYQCSGNGYCTHNDGLENPDPDDFCSYGERKETDEHGTV